MISSWLVLHIHDLWVFLSSLPPFSVSGASSIRNNSPSCFCCCLYIANIPNMQFTKLGMYIYNDFILIILEPKYILWLARPCINICPATLRAWERLERWWLRLTPQRKPEDAVNVPVKVSFVLVCSCRLWSATSWVCRETTCCRCARHLSSSSTWLIFGGAWVWNWETHMNFTQMSCDS